MKLRVTYTVAEDPSFTYRDAIVHTANYDLREMSEAEIDDIAFSVGDKLTCVLESARLLWCKSHEVHDPARYHSEEAQC